MVKVEIKHNRCGGAGECIDICSNGADAKKTDVKKIKCYGCGKEINEDEAISYDIPSCCGIDEIKVCKKCFEEFII